MSDPIPLPMISVLLIAWAWQLVAFAIGWYLRGLKERYDQTS